jgi:DNA invertase Pin-like site-specific DNA recombinase
MIRATAYLRTSSASNVDGDSPHRQNDAVMGYAARTGIDVVSCFWDAAVSGADPMETREGFMALLDHCEIEGIGLVLVEDPTRFARSVIAQELGVALLMSRGVKLVTAFGQDLTDESDASKVFMRQVFGAASEYEKAKVVARLATARAKARAAKGKCEGRKSHAERHPELGRNAKRLARRSPKTGRSRSLRQIAMALAELGYRGGGGAPRSPSIVMGRVA